MSWKIEIEVVAEEQADAILEVLREAEEEVEIEFSFNTSKTGSDKDAGLTVQEYFDKHLDQEPGDSNIAMADETPIESVCGNDCKNAIDAAANLRRHGVAAAIDVLNNTHDDAILQACWEICQTYIVVTE